MLIFLQQGTMLDFQNLLLATVLQIRENPKINAPGISKYPTERPRNFVHKFKIFQKTADVLPSN